MFSLSTFQSTGQSQKLFHLRNIRRDVTVNSDLDRRTEKCFEKVEVEYQENLTLKILSQSVNQDSMSDIKDQIHKFLEVTVCFK